MNTPNTGIFMLPVTQPLPGNLTFNQFVQSVFAGVSGIPSNLVRPSWQPNPPKQPDILTDWIALSHKVNKADYNAYLGRSEGQQATGFIKIKCNPNNGDFITVNSIVITFVSAAPVGSQVLIGPTSGDTAVNLQAFLGTSSSPFINIATYDSFSDTVDITFIALGTVGNAYTLVSGTTNVLMSNTTLLNGGDANNYLQRHEDLQVECSFYGPNAQDTMSATRDSFEIEQNRESLSFGNMVFVSTDEGQHMPDLVNERWINRFIMSFYFRREVQRVYPVLSFTAIKGSILTDNPNLKVIAINRQV